MSEKELIEAIKQAATIPNEARRLEDVEMLCNRLVEDLRFDFRRKLRELLDVGKL